MGGTAETQSQLCRRFSNKSTSWQSYSDLLCLPHFHPAMNHSPRKEGSYSYIPNAEFLSRGLSKNFVYTRLQLCTLILCFLFQRNGTVLLGLRPRTCLLPNVSNCCFWTACINVCMLSEEVMLII